MIGRLAILAALASAACAPPLVKLPGGAGVPLPDDGRAAYAEATRACPGMRTLTAEVAVSGAVAGRRLRVRLLAGVRAAPPAARLEAAAPFGPPLFVFVAAGDDATLLLPRDDRVLPGGHPRAVLEALAGVPLGTADLERILTGCPRSGVASRGRRFGDEWVVVALASEELYLRRDAPGAPWRVAAMIQQTPSGGEPIWRVEYRDRSPGARRTIRLSSIERDRTGSAFDLQLALSQVEVNTPLDAGVFTIEIPPSADPITLDELRRDGPLGQAAAGPRSRP
jgi:hypothetical protein